jgi:hypothetical protein
MLLNGKKVLNISKLPAFLPLNFIGQPARGFERLICLIYILKIFKIVNLIILKIEQKLNSYFKFASKVSKTFYVAKILILRLNAEIIKDNQNPTFKNF